MRASPFGTSAHAALLLFLAACATDGRSLVAPPDDGLLARETGVRLQLVSGGGQTGMVGHALPEPVVVRVVDQADRPVAGAQVNFLPPRDGAVDPRQARTDAEGYARASWTLGSTGEQSLRISGTGGTLVVTAVAQAGTGTELSLVKTLGDGQVSQPGTLLGSLRVRVLRADGTPVRGAEVAWTVTSGGGTLDAPTARTSGGGYASRAWTLGPQAGEQTVTVSTPGAEPVVFTATARGVTLTKTMGDGQTAAAGTLLPRALQVRATAPDGSPAAGALITWTVSSGGGTLSRTESRTAANGRASVQWTLGPQGGAQTVTASAAGTEPVVFTATATGGTQPRGLPVSMHVIPDPLWMQVGDTARLSVVFLDAEGNLVPGPRPTFRSLSSYAQVDADGLVRSVSSGAGAIEVRAWPFREFASVNPWSYRERAGAPREALYVLPEDRALILGDRVRLTGLWVDANGRISVARDVRWSALSPQTLSVSANGMAEALQVPGTRVYAEANGRRGFATIGVRALQDDRTAPLLDGVTIEPLVADVSAGDARVTFTAYGRDDGPSGLLETLEVRVTGADGREHVCSGTGSRCTITLPRGSAAGTYTLGRVTVGDRRGNLNSTWVHVFGNGVEAQPRGFTVRR
jgi:hypothetical protein